MEEVYVAKVLIENIDYNSCEVEVFDDIKTARKWAKAEINRYANEYEGFIDNTTTANYFRMDSGDECITIEIVKSKINKKA